MTCCIHKVRYENGFESLRIVRVTDSYDRLRKSLSTKRRLTTGSQRDIDFIFTYLCSIRNYIRIHIYTILIILLIILYHHLTSNLISDSFLKSAHAKFSNRSFFEIRGRYAIRIQMLFNDII